MEDMSYPTPPSRIPRHAWGIHVTSVTDFAPDYFAGSVSLRSRIYDRFEPLIKITIAILVAVAVTAMVALVATSL